MYKERSKGYQLGLFLAADFDLPGHAATQGAGGGADSQYYVPTSCAACHGHGPELGGPADKLFKFAKPNYLDTDQWYDWMEFDFRGTTTSLNDVVFDGGKDHGSPEYRRAFDAFAALNAEIREESFRAERTAGVATFQTLAADKWLDLHRVDKATPTAKDPQRKPYPSRSIGPAADQWDRNNPDEMRLLRLLDNHCFRCHSSVLYNIFDKPAVRDNAPLIASYLNTPVFDPKGKRLPGFLMPQGRVLEPAERDEIIRLVEKLFLSKRKGGPAR